jgi:hypothetical protein
VQAFAGVVESTSKAKAVSEKDRRLMQKEFEVQVKRLDAIREELVQRELGITAFARAEADAAAAAAAQSREQKRYGLLHTCMAGIVRVCVWSSGEGCMQWIVAGGSG